VLKIVLNITNQASIILECILVIITNMVCSNFSEDIETRYFPSLHMTMI